MPSVVEFEYTAKTVAGEVRRGRLNADDDAQAVRSLRENGMIPLSLSTVKRMKLSLTRPQRFRKISTKEMAFFCRQFAFMLDAGLPVGTALKFAARQSAKGNLSTALAHVLENVETGVSLHESFGHCSGAFSEVFVNMVRSGEKSGALHKMIEQYAMVVERQKQLNNEIQSALMYPALLATMGFGTIIFMLVGVLPKFAEILARSNQKLPATTEVMMSISRISSENLAWIALLSIMVLGIVIKTAQVPSVGLALDKLKLKLPFLGVLFFKSAFARIAQTMAILLSSGATFLESLELAANVAGNRSLKRAMQSMCGGIASGESIGRQFRQLPWLPPMVAQMIATGEETGRMEKVFAKIADYYEKDVETGIKGLTKLIEPLMLLVMGGFVGLITVSLISAIMRTVTSVQ